MIDTRPSEGCAKMAFNILCVVLCVCAAVFAITFVVWFALVTFGIIP